MLRELMLEHFEEPSNKLDAMGSVWHRLHMSKRPCSAQTGRAIHHTPSSSARKQYIGFSRHMYQVGMFKPSQEHSRTPAHISPSQKANAVS